MEAPSPLGSPGSESSLPCHPRESGRVKTIWSFHTASFRSLFRALRQRRFEKIAKNFAPRDHLQKMAEFSHGLECEYPASDAAEPDGGSLSAGPLGARRAWKTQAVRGGTLDPRFREDDTEGIHGNLFETRA